MTIFGSIKAPYADKDFMSIKIVSSSEVEEKGFENIGLFIRSGDVIYISFSIFNSGENSDAVDREPAQISAGSGPSFESRGVCGCQGNDPGAFG
jgi:hypothetical protein